MRLGRRVRLGRREECRGGRWQDGGGEGRKVAESSCVSPAGEGTGKERSLQADVNSDAVAAGGCGYSVCGCDDVWVCGCDVCGWACDMCGWDVSEWCLICGSGGETLITNLHVVACVKCEGMVACVVCSNTSNWYQACEQY